MPSRRQSTTIYLDNAATSWPKPPGVAAAMVDFLKEVGANPGRSGHRLSLEAVQIVDGAHEAVARLFGVRDPLRVVYCANATEALNLALHGYLRPGDHVVTSSMEHNSVMRPLRAMAAGAPQQAVTLTVVPCSPQGFLDPAGLGAALRPESALIVLNHASNVCGSLLPVREAGTMARRHGCLLLVDAAQAAGAVPIDLGQDGVDLLSFTGPKALGGPTGTGGLVIGERVDLNRLVPLKQGGTGSHSEREEQPDFLPDLFESGTLNAVGLAGLGAALGRVLERGGEAIREHEIELTGRLIEGLCAVPRVTVYGGLGATRQTTTVSFNVAGMAPSEVGLCLDEQYGGLCRVGLHCAPAAHKNLGTFPTGTVRFALGALASHNQIERAPSAVGAIARSG